MKKEERESQIVRSPKSTNLFHLVPVLLPGTVSNRSLSLSRSALSSTSFFRLHQFRRAVIPDLGLDLIRTKAVSLSVIPLIDETSNSPLESHPRRAMHPLWPVISVAALLTWARSSSLTSLISPLIGFFFLFTLQRVWESLVHSDKGTRNESILGFLVI